MTEYTQVVNLHEINEWQLALDKEISDVRGVDLSNAHVQSDLEFAFFTEVHELANVLQFFKYWKKQPVAYSQPEAQEEWADCLHMLVSLGVRKNYHKMVRQTQTHMDYEDIPMDMLFKELIQLRPSTMGQYSLMLMHLVTIGAKLGMTPEKMIEQYKRKNEINYKRLTT